MDEHDIKAQLESLDLSDSKSIEDYARNLVGASFQDILDLGVQEVDSVTNRSNQKYVLGEIAERTQMHADRKSVV